jgi:hypothetical protein
VTGYLRIGGALTLGVLIVLGAFILGNKTTEVGEAKLQVADAHTYIEPTDSDGDGTPDWEEDFSAKVFEAITAPTSTAAEAEAYEPPTTFTGKFAEAFFTDYMEGKMEGADTSNSAEFINQAVAAIETNTKSKLYSGLDIEMIPDTDASIRDYGNAIGEILVRYPATHENEMEILKRATEKNDPEILTALEPIRTIYENYVEDTLNVHVPRSLAKEHLDLLNAYEAVRTDINAMEQMFTDPLYSLARVKRYQDDAAGMYFALQQILLRLEEHGVVYSKDEQGAVLYLVR